MPLYISLFKYIVGFFLESIPRIDVQSVFMCVTFSSHTMPIGIFVKTKLISRFQLIRIPLRVLTYLLKGKYYITIACYPVLESPLLEVTNDDGFIQFIGARLRELRERQFFLSPRLRV